ncbi:tail fiber domain-containing protein, partial [Candidatus Woesebacteria bacterium]|nr:tail fiber domain-containing protein [Candidatus Woesebacteria bacterium]
KYAADTQKNQYQSLSTAISSNGAGNIGIGTTNPGYTLDVKSTGTDIARFIGSNSTGCTLSDGGIIACSSDRNLKKNIVNTNLGLDAVMNLRPVEFNWNSQANGDKKYLGFIAQDVEQIASELVTIDSNGYRQLNSIGLIPIVAKAIQEQQGQLVMINEQLSMTNPNTLNDIVTQQAEMLRQAQHDTARIDAWNGLFISIQSIIQSIQDAIVALQGQFGLMQSDIVSTKSQVASLSASLTTLSSWKEAIASGSGVLGASDSALLDHIATVSALTVQNRTTTFDLTVLNKLTTGVIELGAGIDGDEINASTGIRFQTLSQGPIDFMNGKVIIDVDGSLKAVKVSADRYAASKEQGTIGLGLLQAGKTSVAITTPLVNENSRIFVTPLTKTNKPLYVSMVVDGSHFIVSLGETPPTDIRFNWWIVEEE